MTAKGDRRMVCVRLSQAGVDQLDERTAKEGDEDRSALIRRLLAYGLLHMPRGWNR